MANKRIYYLGGLDLPPGEESTYFIKSGQQVFSCPPIGEYLEVADYVANDIMNKYGNQVFHTDMLLAKRAAAGELQFRRSNDENGTSVVVTEVMSEEAILQRAAEILAERDAQNGSDNSDEELVKAMSAPEEVESDPILESTAEPEKDEKPAKRRSRSKKEAEE